MDLKKYIKEKRQYVNQRLEQYLESQQDHPLSEVFKYALEGGKRFRPLLILASAEACGIEGEKVMPAALAIELIHNFSLIHDDLPCMDNDDYRRDLETCHKKFGEWTALLAGDALLIDAFSLLTENSHIEGISKDSVLKVIKLFADSAGYIGMTGGQVMDMKFQSANHTDKSALIEMHRKKTGALITASTLSGGILAGAGEKTLQALKTYGENVGLTYQIIDDILDMDSGSDPDSISFPAVFGKEEALRMAEEATETAVNAAVSIGDKAEPLIELAKYLLYRKY